MNVVGVVTLGKLIEAHRDGDEQKFKTYVEFIAKAYEQQGNDRGARIIRNSYAGSNKESSKVILDAASPNEQDIAVYLSESEIVKVTSTIEDDNLRNRVLSVLWSKKRAVKDVTKENRDIADVSDLQIRKI